MTFRQTWSIVLGLVVLLAYASPATATAWQANFPTNNIKGFQHVQCGGQGATCPCTSGNFDCRNPGSNYASGSCGTSTTSLPTGGRFQIVSDPAGSGAQVEQINLREGDYWTDCSNVVTVRNELVYSQDANDGNPSLYGEGSDRYFAWSIYFKSDYFSSWSCDPSESHTGTACANDSGGSYNPWNAITQWHAGDHGSWGEGVALRRVGASHTYRMLFMGGDYEIWNDGANTTTPISLNTWYDFIVHIHFSSNSSVGYFELWLGKNGGQIQKQNFNSVCGGTDPTKCMFQTLDPHDANPNISTGDGAYFKQGLYRNWSLSDNVNIYYKDTRTGASFSEVSSDFAMSANPTAVTSTTAGSTSSTITLQSSGFSGTVSLSTAVSPSGPSVSLSQTSLSLSSGGSASSTLSLNPGTAGVGQYVVTVTATSGSMSHTTQVTYNITTVTSPSIATLSDAFNGTAIDSSLWNVSAVGGVIAEGGGTLNLTPNPNTGTAQLAVSSKGSYSLSSASAHVKVPMIVSNSSGVNEDLALTLDGNNYVEWAYQQGTLYAYAVVGGTTTTVTSLSYSSTNHAWWRIRQADTHVYWDTSADGTTWAQQGLISTNSLFAVTSLRLYFYAGTSGSGASSPGTASFASFNVPPTTNNPPMSSLVDTFAGTFINSNTWSTSQVNGTASESGGTLALACNANTGGAQVAVFSINAYNLSGSSAYVKAPSVVSSGGNVDEDFALLLDGANYVEWLYQQGNLYAFAVVAGARTTVASLTYSSTNHAWWRIRQSGSLVYWDTSSDGTNWTPQGSLSTSNLFALTSLRAYFYAETFGAGSPTPGTAQFAYLNSQPPGSSNPWADSFGGTSIDTSKWTVYTNLGTATEGGGAVSLTPNANTNTAQVQLVSNSSASLIGNSASVQAVGVLNAANDTDEDFSLCLNGNRNNKLSWVYQQGNLYAIYSISASDTILVSLTYNANTHLYWRIRESSGRVYWDTSADGLNWVNQASISDSSLFSLTTLKGQLYVETWGSNNPSPGIARFANMK